MGVCACTNMFNLRQPQIWWSRIELRRRYTTIRWVRGGVGRGDGEVGGAWVAGFKNGALENNGRLRVQQVVPSVWRGFGARALTRTYHPSPRDGETRQEGRVAIARLACLGLCFSVLG
jgi:hypothetical protein